MKILYTVHHINSENGPYIITRNLREQIELLGHEVDIKCLSNMPKLFWSSRLHELFFNVYLALFMVFSSRKYDIIDTHGQDLWIWHLLGRPGKSHSAILIVRSHNLEALYYKGLISKKEFSAHRTYAQIKLWAAHIMWKTADAVFISNDAEANYLINKYQCNSKIYKVRNGFNKNLESLPRKTSFSSDRIIFATVFTWTKRKGIDDVRLLVEKLTEQKIPFTYHCLGCIRPESLVRSQFPSDAQSNIKVIPKYENKDLPKLLKGIDYFYFPSHFECAPMALLETMALGLIPISTRCGNSKDLIKDGVSGFFVEQENHQQALDILKRHYHLNDEKEKMSQAAQDSVLSYNWPAIGRETVDMYKTISQKKFLNPGPATEQAGSTRGASCNGV